MGFATTWPTKSTSAATASPQVDQGIRPPWRSRNNAVSNEQIDPEPMKIVLQIRTEDMAFAADHETSPKDLLHESG